MSAHPFDPDCSSAGTDIPQQLVGSWCETRKRYRTNLALGHLPVGFESLVR